MYLTYPFRSGVMAVLALLMTGLVARAQPGSDSASSRGFLGVMVGPAMGGGAASWCWT
ncbi:MAG: hypothetical protein ACLQIB_12870 [Isosphaeraceae bacterium]